MILQALNRYYQRLAEEHDESGASKVPSYGFSKEQIAYILILSPQGEVLNVIANMTRDKKPSAKTIAVPRPEKRTSGIKANFLWDKTAYVLGVTGSHKKTAIPSWSVKQETFAFP